MVHATAKVNRVQTPDIYNGSGGGGALANCSYEEATVGTESKVGATMRYMAVATGSGRHMVGLRVYRSI